MPPAAVTTTVEVTVPPGAVIVVPDTVEVSVSVTVLALATPALLADTVLVTVIVDAVTALVTVAAFWVTV